MARKIKFRNISFKILNKISYSISMKYFFSLTLAEMGITPLLLIIIISFSVLFIVAFVLSSKNMDSDGIMAWMMKKPEDWVGNQKS